MFNLLNLFNIALSGGIDFYNSESHAGNSFLPFIGFMLFLIGMVMTFIGAVKMSTAKRRWNIFYDKRDAVDFTEDKYVKERKVGKVLVIIGCIMMVLSFIIL